jgi:hypothetical protein
MALTTVALTKTKAWFQNMISHGTYTIGNVTTNMPIHSLSLTGDVITLRFLLADNVSGNITRFRVIDKDGEIFDDQPDSIQKPAINGLLITFKYTISKV